MTKILFVCHGNICRSSMAACVFADLAEKAGAAGRFVVDSAATSTEEIGNPIYPPAARKLREKGVRVLPHAARQMTAADCREFDFIIGMDAANLRGMRRISGVERAEKLSLLLDWTDRPRDVADPWYTGDFETAYRDIDAGCRALLEKLTRGTPPCGQPA